MSRRVMVEQKEAIKEWAKMTFSATFSCLLWKSHPSSQPVFVLQLLSTLSNWAEGALVTPHQTLAEAWAGRPCFDPLLVRFKGLL